MRKGVGAKRAAIYQQIIEQGINVPFLLLMLMKAVPGYDSKEGDVHDMGKQFERVMSLLQKYNIERVNCIE